MKINDPVARAEVEDTFERYEAALMSDDLEALAGFFWADPLTIRYGLGVNSYGHDEISAARRSRAAEPRTLERTVITTYGSDFATADTEFTRSRTGRRGRQTQTWVRQPEGWRVVSAHVSWFDEPDWASEEGAT